MSKTSKLVKNTAIIALGTLSTKALTFFLLPLYTNALNPEDYGLIDVLMTMSSLIIPFATLEINSGVFRFLIGNEKRINYSHKEVMSTGIVIELFGLSITLLLSSIVNWFYAIPHYKALTFYILSLAVLKLSLDTTRGLGDMLSYSVANFFITFISLVLNVVFILVCKWGAVSILIALATGNFLGIFFLFFKERIYKYVDCKAVSRMVGKDILRYTFPLIPNTISWWVVSASDRVIILEFLGATANGIYAAAHKIPGIYTTLFTVFNTAWVESVARNASDHTFVENTVKTSVNIMIYMLLGIMSCTNLFFNLLIGKKYSGSYWHIFILLIAIFFSSLSSLYGGIISGKMDSKTIAYTTLIGAVINILVNLGGIKQIGLYAASISTTVSYVVISIIRAKCVGKWYQIKLFNAKDLVLLPLGCLCILGYYFHSGILSVIAIVAIVICFAAVNKNIFWGFMSKITRKS